MRNELNLKYARLECQSEPQMEVDQALATFRQFKGKCTNCGKFGHKSSECQSKNGSKNETNADKQIGRSIFKYKKSLNYLWHAEELKLKYVRLKQQSKVQLEVDQALAAFRQFKDKCTNCGKFGHKSTECQSKSSSKNDSAAEINEHKE